MREKRTLVSWIGTTDLLAMFEDLGAHGEELQKTTNIQGRIVEKPGPLKTAIQEGLFSSVHLLSNFSDPINKAFGLWLGVNPVIHSVTLEDPTDYEVIFDCSNQILREITKNQHLTKDQLCILLSPGTPAMAVIWVLLGKSRYLAKLYQTGRGKLHEAKIPEALFEEIMPGLIRDRDISFQHLAARNPSDVEGFDQVIGCSEQIRLAVGRAQRAALRDVSVLLVGESGTGKEVFAQAIHKASRRRNRHFEAINCAAIPKELLESELFGHMKGAFTGAVGDREGAFTRADGGTLFLDEIGECDPQLQSKLLRVLQPPPGKSSCYREFRPVGGTSVQKCDVRIIAATNRNLQDEIKANRFREDLYYRLAVITLRLPTLRERSSDIPILAQAFLDRINQDFGLHEPGYEPKVMSSKAIKLICAYEWPGNVRQLNNALQQAAVMAETDLIDRADIVDAIGEHIQSDTLNRTGADLEEGFDLESYLNNLRMEFLRKAMKQANGIKSKAAKMLGIKHYQTLDAQLERLSVDWRQDGK